jgi:hypothetical protein
MSDLPLGEPPQHASAVNDGLAWARLQELLRRQLELVHQGRLAAARELFEQTDRCVQEIARAAGPTPSGQGVERLYRELSLALAAQRAEVSAALQTIRRGKRALSAYSRIGTFRR